MIPFFPVVGLLLGVLTAGFDFVVSHFWSVPTAALLDVLFLAALTGAFHIDGLGDAADGLYGRRPREKVLAIMKDSRIGVMGLMAVTSALAVKWAGIYELDAHRLLLIAIIPAYARGSMIMGISILPYGRPEGGTGLAFFGEKPGVSDLKWLAIPIGLSLLLGWKFFWINAVYAVLVFAILRFYKNRMGCITGDMLGAMTEMIEAGLFLMVSMGFAA
jgi:adenosylcobinamide-GDP ribazoletransferase